MIISRFTIKFIKNYFFAKGVGLKKVIIIGSDEIAQTLASRLATDRTLGAVPVGFLDDNIEKFKVFILLKNNFCNNYMAEINIGRKKNIIKIDDFYSFPKKLKTLQN